MSFYGNRLLTVKEVADLCQVSPRTVFRWLSLGELAAVRIGNVTRIRKDDLEAFFQAHLTGTTQDQLVSQENP